jgi:hypothetical protein
LALACLRHGLPAVHGRGLDLLPTDVAAQFEGSLVRQLDGAELSRAFRVVADRLCYEIQIADPSLAERLNSALTVLIESDTL